MTKESAHQDLKAVVKECRTLFETLSEQNTKLVQDWPKLTESLGPGLLAEMEVVSSQSPSPDGDRIPNPHLFGEAMVEAQKNFFHAWETCLLLRARLESLATEKATHESELARLSEQVMLLSQSRAQAEEEKKRLESELEALSLERDKARHEREDLEGQLQKNESERATIANHLAERESELQSERENGVGLRSKLEELENRNREIDERASSLEKEAKELADKIKPLEAELERANRRAGELETAVSNHEKHSVPLQEHETLKQELDRIRTEREELTGGHQQLQEEFESLREKHEKASGELEEARSSVDNALRERDQTDGRLKQIEKQVEEKDATIEHLEKSLEEVREKNKKLSSALEEAYRDIDILRQMTRTGFENGNGLGPEPNMPPRIERPGEEDALDGAGQPVHATEDEAGPPQDAGLSTESARTAVGEASQDEEDFFPYPEITGEGLEGFKGLKVLLVGGDVRFQKDYEHLFGMAETVVRYYPTIAALEKQGMQRSVRDSNLVIVFGGALEETGYQRLQNLAQEYGRYFIDHSSSGLVSLFHRLQMANNDL